MASFDYDVVIIGSGFGGSVAALRAADKGYRVGVMESGRRWKDEDIPHHRPVPSAVPGHQTSADAPRGAGDDGDLLHGHDDELLRGSCSPVPTGSGGARPSAASKRICCSSYSSLTSALPIEPSAPMS